MWLRCFNTSRIGAVWCSNRGFFPMVSPAICKSEFVLLHSWRSVPSRISPFDAEKIFYHCMVVSRFDTSNVVPEGGSSWACDERRCFQVAFDSFKGTSNDCSNRDCWIGFVDFIKPSIPDNRSAFFLEYRSFYLALYNHIFFSLGRWCGKICILLFHSIHKRGNRFLFRLCL